MSRIRPDATRTGGMILQAFLYGLYVVTFFKALSSLLRDRSTPTYRWGKRSQIQWLTFSVCLLLYTNSTLNVCLGIVRTLRVDRIFEQEELSGWMNMLRGFNCALQILLADGILIYRAWMVNSRKPRFVAFPLFLWAAGLASCTGGLAFQSRSSLYSPSRDLTIMYDMWIVFWTGTVVLNVYCTSLIAYRVWKVDRSTTGIRVANPTSERDGNATLLSVILVTVESGLLYTIASIFACVSTITKSDSIFITTAADIIIIGISFNLIIIYVGKKRDSRREASLSGGIAVTTIRFDHSDPLPGRGDVEVNRIKGTHDGMKG